MPIDLSTLETREASTLGGRVKNSSLKQANLEASSAAAAVSRVEGNFVGESLLKSLPPD